MVTKYDQIIETLTEIKVHLASMDGHLKELNGRVTRNVTDIRDDRKKLESHDARLDKIDKKIAYWAGGIAVVMAFVSFIINYFI